MKEINGEAKVWNLANVIITAMAGIIAILIAAGFNSLGNKIETGDNLINSRLVVIEGNQKSFNECIMKMQADITRMDTLQKVRLDREIRDENKRNGIR
jgi:hypothetical protein